jgi:hypothetical protein
MLTLPFRLMIVVFTSKAFTEWAATHVQREGDTPFNPYLTFLFIALYVLPFSELRIQLTEAPQCWLVRNSLSWLVPLPGVPSFRILESLLFTLCSCVRLFICSPDIG